MKMSTFGCGWIIPQIHIHTLLNWIKYDFDSMIKRRERKKITMVVKECIQLDCFMCVRQSQCQSQRKKIENDIKWKKKKQRRLHKSHYSRNVSPRISLEDNKKSDVQIKINKIHEHRDRRNEWADMEKETHIHREKQRDCRPENSCMRLSL